MGKIQLFSVVLVAVLSFFLYQKVSNFVADGEFNETLPEFYWGPESSKGVKEDKSIKPFKINVEQKVLDQLKAKLSEELNSSRFTPPLEGIGFEYGFNTNQLKAIVSHWLNKYNWREREKALNKYPQFTTTIAGLKIHFQHVKSGDSSKKYKKTRPLLLLHGWPGSFVEFQKIIPLLTDPKDSDVNFELVIPSLPGYGFSDGAIRPGLGMVETAQIFVELMNRLGHGKFYIQGGDWGAGIGNVMSKVYPEKVAAYHSNFCISQHPRSYLKTFIGSFAPSYFYSTEEAERFLPQSKNFAWLLRETGYLHIQATKPDTLGVGLSHSPGGLAAYILEKFSGWTHPSYMEKEDGGLTLKFSLDEMLDDVMVYWVTKSITTSVRFYAENFSNRQRAYELDKVPVKVPTACLVPRWEQYISQPKSIVQDSYTNLISYNYAKDGGHFFALEHPDVLAEDFLNFAKIAESKENLFA